MRFRQRATHSLLRCDAVWMITSSRREKGAHEIDTMRCPKLNKRNVNDTVMYVVLRSSVVDRGSDATRMTCVRIESTTIMI